jgi:hypothetical protein
MINKLSKYIEIKEDKFRNKVSITQKRCFFVWNPEVPLNQRTLNNSFDSKYISFYFPYPFSKSIDQTTFRVEKCEGNIKIFIDFYGKLRSDIKQRDELIIRLNDSQNYPLPFAYYDIITLIDNYGNPTGEWSHTFGFEIPLELLKAICEANMVESNIARRWSWQTHARLIYNIAIDNQKYYSELANLVESIFRKEEKKKRLEDDTDRLCELIYERDKFTSNGVTLECSADEFISKFCSEQSFSETSESINALIPLLEELAEILQAKYPEETVDGSFNIKTIDHYLSVLKAADSYIKQELDKKQKKRLGLTFGILAIAVTITLLCVI